MIKKILIGLFLTGLIIYGYAQSQVPSLERNWSLDQVVLPEVLITEDEVTITNVRNFTYRSPTDYTPSYYDTTVLLSDLKTVDYIVEPFGDIGAAHTFLSFGFGSGQRIAISVEIRKEIGESFSPWLGLLNQYELMYVIADERDVINLRANHRKHQVYVYPTTATAQQAKLLFLNMLERSNDLRVNPVFYNTLTNNCTTNIAKHINKIGSTEIGFDFRLILPEYSDVLAQELGFIAPGISIAEARAKYLVNYLAKEHQFDQAFSEQIRVEKEVEQVYEVVKVIDGDTIEVVVEGETKRVRYIGIDTPEKYPEEKAECLSDEAKIINETLVLGKSVRLLKDTRDIDDYGRLLRYVYVGDTFVNKELVAEGYARAVVYEPDNNHTATLNLAEREAKEQQKGIWSEVCISQD